MKMVRDNAREISFEELGLWLKKMKDSPGLLFLHEKKRRPSDYFREKRDRILSDGLDHVKDCVIGNKEDVPDELAFVGL